MTLKMGLTSRFKKITNTFRLKVQPINYIYPGARNYFIDLSELCCVSDIYSEFFCMLSQVCHNIQSLDITFVSVVSNGFADLISAQQNLKYLSVTKDDITPLLANLPNSLIGLSIYGKEC